MLMLAFFRKSLHWQWNEEHAVVCSHYQLKLIFTVVVCSLSIVYEIETGDYILTLKQTHVELRNANYIQKSRFIM